MSNSQRFSLFILMVLTIFFSSTLYSIEVCPDCPNGCIAKQKVKTVSPSGKVGECPEGCLAYSMVEEMSDGVMCIKGENYSVGPYAEYQQATRERNIFVHTAIGQKKGSWLATGYIAAIWDFAYGVTDNLQLGFTTIVPIAVVGVVPKIKGHGALIKDRLYLSGAVGGGFLTSYVGGSDIGWYGTTELLMSVVEKEHTFTFGVNGAMQGVGSESDIEWGIFPEAAYRFGFLPAWSFQMEMIPIIGGDNNGPYSAKDIYWILAYGFRAHGKLVYGDFGLFLPIRQDFIEDSWKYVPLGLPYFTLGFIF